MSFKPEISEVGIYNEALALLPADPVQDKDEDSVEARECNRVYKSIVARLLEQHHWNLATRRVALAVLANDRPGEWGFRYAKPDDMAYPASLAGAGGFFASGWQWGAGGFLFSGAKLFEQVGGSFYARVPQAVLEYTTFDITEGDFTSMLKDVVVQKLAASICMPITKSAQQAAQLASQAEYFRLQAIANDLNRNHQTYGNKPTEIEMVRGAGMGEMPWSGGYALDPVANPANTGL